ncbi:uncharacterized protein LOC132065515 [Lycium ferocissimum]|uniref:uncharacterized protein LOC132065515 n=1 Tax=Lycium ferocissimum TaxID=112874 RepID=UPI0028155C9E|nr:uncharacterized protein LOC132065515 [Lycium ferocissimum]
MLLPPVPDEWAAQAFTKGLNPRSSNASLKLKENLLEFSATTWADVHNRYESKIRVEDDQLGLPPGPVTRTKNDRSKRTFEPEYNPLDRGLRDEVARLLKNGHLREFLSERGRNNYKNREGNKKVEPEEPQHIINMIIGGVEIPRGPVMKRTKFSITREKRSRDYVPDGFISFSNEEVEGITQPHNDALAISVLINKTHVKRILIDPGSSANIIRWKVVEQLGLLDQIVPTTRVLNGFNMACETTKGEITLPVNTVGVV